MYFMSYCLRILKLVPFHISRTHFSAVIQWDETTRAPKHTSKYLFCNENKDDCKIQNFSKPIGRLAVS